MSKLLSYHNLVDGTDFVESDFYDKRHIDLITDPEGGNTNRPPTSIPSPFAAMDITRTAFKRILAYPDLKGEQIDQKFVSQCWDIGMMFFNRNQFPHPEYQIIAWDKVRDLAAMAKQGEQSGARRLADALKIYITQDAHSYNFDLVDHIFMLQYKYELVGGTSPSTLFFSTLNPIEMRSDLHVKLAGDSDVLFDNKYKTLYERDPKFQLYVYSLYKHLSSRVPNFTNICPEISQYLESNLEILRDVDSQAYTRIRQLTSEDYMNFENIVALDNALVSILQIPLRGQSLRVDGLSDFKILSEKYQGKLPLVLKRGVHGRTRQGEQMVYFDCDYTKEIDSQIPAFSSVADINERLLPGLTQQRYPHLLVSDFFEDSIIKLIYPIDRNKYFDGNLTSETANHGYLLPLKRRIFDFFDTAYLMQHRHLDGKPVFEMESRGSGGVVAILRLPIQKGEYIEYRRLYDAPASATFHAKPDLAREIGGSQEALLTVNIFPFVVSRVEDVQCSYRIQCIDRERGVSRKSDLVFFHDQQRDPLQCLDTVSRSNIEDHDYGSTVYVLEEQFNYIQLTNGSCSGIIIPKLREYKGGVDKYHFSIDFGTTNTHIEFLRGSVVEPEPFTITRSEYQIGVLYDEDFMVKYSGDERSVLTFALEHELMPLMIDTDHHYKFPQRTVISESDKLTEYQSVSALAEFNIPFVYERDSQPSHHRISTNLKWSNYIQDKVQQRRVKSYLENLVLMMKAKVMLGNGDVKNTRFTWFYPSSMLKPRLDQLSNIWTDYIRKHFGRQAPIIQLSESVAPFYYYKRRLGIGANAVPAVCVDIGGGTTDIVVFQNNTPSHISSFRFAANSVFGDGFSRSPQINGFVKKWLPDIQRALNDSNNSTHTLKLRKALVDIEKRGKSEDIIAFLMSLEANREVRENRLPISFQQNLIDDSNLKFVILLFYGAVIYHVGRLARAFRINAPRDFIFSGNGSKVIRLLDSSSDLKNLSKFTSLIFAKGFEGDIKAEVALHQYSDPKEITCRGGLLFDGEVKELDQLKRILVGVNAEPEGKLRYPDVDGVICNQVVDEVVRFVDAFFDVNDEFNYYHNFLINGAILESSRELLSDRDKLMDSLLMGLDIKNKELGDNRKIELEETLFFYPLVDLIGELAYELSKV